MRKTLSIFLSLLITLSAAVFSAQAAAVKNKTMREYTSRTFTLEKPSAKKYYCQVKYNTKNYIKVKFKDNGSDCTLKITAKKSTKSKKPVVKIYYKNESGKNVNIRVYRFTVKKVGTVKFSNMKFNVNTSQKASLYNPFAYEYKLRASKSGIVKIPTKCKKNGSRRIYSLKALKAGKTTVSVYLKGTSQKVGEFVITTGNFKTKINPKYKTLTLRYNSHGSSTYMSKSHFDASQMLMYKRAGAKYYVVTSNDKVSSVVNDMVVYSTGKGSTTATVFQTKGDSTTTVGTFKIKSLSASMSYVAKQNSAFYNNKIFGHGDNTEYLDLTNSKTVALKPIIKDRLINNSLTGSHFGSSAYRILFKSSAPKTAKVDSSGKVTAIKTGAAKITCTIKFSDKSVFKSVCRVVVE